MSTTEQTVTAPADVDAAADEIASRLRTKTVDQVIAIGERTGWWPAQLVDWVADGRNGPPPTADVGYQTLREEEDTRLGQLEEQLADAGVIEYADAATVAEVAGRIAAQDAELLDRLADGAPARAPADMPTAGSAYIAVLQARDLGVDHSYQRPLDEARVKRMAATWDPRMLSTIDVSDRGPDEHPRYAVINGQHRAAAAARVSPAGADVWLACLVHEGLDVAGEARLMHELDRTTKKLTGWDRWHSRHAAGDPAVLTVERIAARHGLQVDPNPVDGSLRSYGAAEKLLARGGEELLDTTLSVLHAAYGKAFSAYQAPLVTGVGSLLQVYGGSVDVDRLTRALAGIRPEKLRASATALRDVEGGQLNELMTRAIVGQYNRTSGPGPRLDGRT